MKKKWTWSQSVLATAAVALLVTGSLLFAAPGGVKGKPPKDDGGGDGGGTTELPPVRYRINFPQLPANADATDTMWVNGRNNWGQVVGKYSAEDGWRPFLFDPNAGQVMDLNAIVTGGLPDGWRLRSALAISDWMVVVGSMEEISSGLILPFAIDLAAENPVVDLLPDVGPLDSWGRKINENGDILGYYQTADGRWEHWIFNPGLYGDSASREPRDGTPQDMSGEIPEFLLQSALSGAFHLNNPVGDSPAQIAGVNADGIAFRYTLGDAEPEWFPELNVHWDRIVSINDSGTFCGLSFPSKGKPRTDPFRFNQSLELLPLDVSWSIFEEFLQDMNSSGDLISQQYVYRNDWGWVHINDLVVGTEADLQVWHSLTSDMSVINDRAGQIGSGQIAGRLGSILFVLTPEPTP